MRCWLLATLLAGSALLALPAAALDVEKVVDRLREDPVLVEPESAVRIDEEAVRAAFQDLPVPTYALVVPQSEVDAEESGIDGALLRVVEALEDPRAVVVVVTDAGELQAGEGGASGVDASVLLDGIVQSRSEQEFNGQTLTDALLAFAAAVERHGDTGAERGIRGSNRQTVAVAGLVGIAVVAGGLLWARTQRRVSQQLPPAGDGSDSGAW
ncbi:MAG: hypothetical protein WD794_09925 [Mycobacteriales bacterium]